jgi:hypothetical protein
MKRMVEVPLNGGGSMLVEVELDEEEQDGMVPAARAGEMAVRATHTLQEALEQVQPGAEAVVTKLREMSARPDEMEVTFGLKMSAEAGAFIASASTEANFTVLLRWNRS